MRSYVRSLASSKATNSENADNAVNDLHLHNYYNWTYYDMRWSDMNHRNTSNFLNKSFEFIFSIDFTPLYETIRLMFLVVCWGSPLSFYYRT